jgi:hypothetical protein
VHGCANIDRIALQTQASRKHLVPIRSSVLDVQVFGPKVSVVLPIYGGKPRVTRARLYNNRMSHVVLLEETRDQRTELCSKAGEDVAVVLLLSVMDFQRTAAATGGLGFGHCRKCLEYVACGLDRR